MRGYDSAEGIIQNLKDAGCDAVTIQAFMNDLQAGKPEKGVRLLQKHRCGLLNALHENQKRIDCLDYLLFLLQKRNGK